MFCRRCGSNINDNDTYCFNCGFKQTASNVNFTQPISLEPKPKSVVKKPWFWLLIIAAALCIYGNFSSIISIFNNTDFFENFEDYNQNDPFSYYEYFDDYNEDFEYDYDFE